MLFRSQAIDNIASMQLSCQGTIGGEICQRPQCWFFRGGRGLLAEQGQAVLSGDNRYHAIFANAGPAKFVNNSRTAPALMAWNAMVRVIGPDVEEESLVPLADFYRIPRHDGQRETMLRPGQLISHILLPPAGDRTSATYEVRHGAVRVVTQRFRGKAGEFHREIHRQTHAGRPDHRDLCPEFTNGRFLFAFETGRGDHERNVPLNATIGNVEGRVRHRKINDNVQLGRQFGCEIGRAHV